MRVGDQGALFLVQDERLPVPAIEGFISELAGFLQSVKCCTLVFLASAATKFRYHPEQLRLGICIRRYGQLPKALSVLPELEDTSSCSRDGLICKLRGAGARGLARHLAALPQGNGNPLAEPRFLLAYTDLEPSNDSVFAELPDGHEDSPQEGKSFGDDEPQTRLPQWAVLSAFSSL